MNNRYLERINLTLIGLDKTNERVSALEQEIEEVKEHSEANLMASTDLGINSMGTNEALLMTITDIGMAVMDIQKQLNELRGDK